MIPRLKEQYNKNVVPEIMKKYNLKNKLQVPVFSKIIVNVGVGESKDNPKLLQAFSDELSKITGQKSVITKAKKSISNFKLRKGMPIGSCVTLRGNIMWEFYDRLVNVALPRVRDFRGVSSDSFDKFGHYTLGIKEQIIFPEINIDKIEKVHGFSITMVMKHSKKKEIVKEMLTMMGMPFRK